MSATARGIACAAILWLTVSAGSAGTVSTRSWHPYRDQNALVAVGMTKGEVEAKAGKPHRAEVVSPGAEDQPAASVWSYVRKGQNAEIANLVFLGDELVKIEVSALP